MPAKHEQRGFTWHAMQAQNRHPYKLLHYHMPSAQSGVLSLKTSRKSGIRAHRTGSLLGSAKGGTLRAGMGVGKCKEWYLESRNECGKVQRGVP